MNKTASAGFLFMLPVLRTSHREVMDDLHRIVVADFLAGVALD
jgi:hypothetical protein